MSSITDPINTTAQGAEWRRERHRTRRLPELAELIYQFDKGSHSARFADLRSDAARGVYISAALSLFEPSTAADRMRQVQVGDAQEFADREQDDRAVAAQAQQDIKRYGQRATVAIGPCFICGERLTPLDAFALHITPSFTADVHGKCASDDARCEVVSSFAFRFIGGAR